MVSDAYAAMNVSDAQLHLVGQSNINVSAQNKDFAKKKTFQDIMNNGGHANANSQRSIKEKKAGPEDSQPA